MFEAGATEINAGQSYIGELEAQVQRIVKALDGAPVLWIIPRFEELLWTGTHRHSRTGVLDMVLQGMEGAELHIAGEVDPAGYERLLRERPTVRERVRAAADPARRPRPPRASSPAPWRPTPPWPTRRSRSPATSCRARCPGRCSRCWTPRGGAPATRTASTTCWRASPSAPGMPLTMLDERERLDVDGLRRFFGARVVGQPEAVDLMVERIALLKAGLTDPTRPLAVLLFVGPTGTGKTEIAKALAEYLFGSSERMIRIDLSEYQNEGSARRLLGTGEPEDASLVASIRKQPFSVVLLDEFEKADPGVFDLFLQVFDDGRLSDPRGEAADFRHAVIIMTSNLGATIPTGAGIGLLAGRRRVRRPQRRAGGDADVPARVRQPDRPHRRVPAVVAAGDARDPERGARVRAGAARAAFAAVGGGVRRLRPGVPVERGLHARPRRAALEARGRAAFPDAFGARHRRPRRARAATSSCSSAPGATA